MNLIKWSIVLFFAFLSIVPRLFYLNIPFERDEGMYASVADVIDRGGLPYRDVFDNKPPGIYYLYHISFKIFGHAVSSPRILAALFTVAACVLAYTLVQRMTSSRFAGVFTMALLGLASSSPAYLGFEANTEIFTVPFLLGGILLLLDEDPTIFKYFASGLLFGLAFVVKQPTITIGIAMFAYRVSRSIKTPKKFIFGSFFYIIGGSVPILAFILYFAYRGGLDDLWEASFTYNFSFVSGSPFQHTLFRFAVAIKDAINADPITWLAGLAGISFFLAFSREKDHKRFFLFILIGAAVCVPMGRFFIQHYFIFFIPFLVIGAGLGVGQLLKSGMKSMIIMPLVIVIFMISVFTNVKYYRMTERDFLQNTYGYAPFYQSTILGKHLRLPSGKDATVFIIGSEAEILFYSGLSSPVRFFDFYPLMVETKFRTLFRDEALYTVSDNMPDYLILVNERTSHFISGKDPFIMSLMQLFSQYKLAAFIDDVSDEVIDYRPGMDVERLTSGDGNILVFVKEPTSTDLLDFGPIFESYLKRVSLRLQIERYLQ